MSEEYRDGGLLTEPDFAVILATARPDFDRGAGVGDGGNGHALLELQAECEWRDHKRYVEVPAGFVFDGASVPNAVYGVLDANALDLIIPGMLHDYLYRSDAAMLHPDTREPREFDREDADKVLSKAAQMCGCDWDDAKKIFYGVRVGGSGAYQQKTVGWYP